MWSAGRYYLRRHRWLTPAAALLGLCALAVGLNVAGVRDRLTGGPGPPIKLAVLPFQNLTGDPEQEYFSDGLTDEMITRLGRLHPQRLSVIARTSSMRYKKRDLPIDQIGRELGVDYVMEGSARREGSRVRISATLVQVSDQTQRWSDSFERDLTGILTLQTRHCRRRRARVDADAASQRAGSSRQDTSRESRGLRGVLEGTLPLAGADAPGSRSGHELLRAGGAEGPELRRGLHGPRHRVGPAL